MRKMPSTITFVTIVFSGFTMAQTTTQSSTTALTPVVVTANPIIDRVRVDALKCSGIAGNASNWAALGGELLYGAEVAHPDIPRGIDAQELIYMMQMAKLDVMDVLRAATSKAGQHLNLPLLGTLQKDALGILSQSGEILLIT